MVLDCGSCGIDTGCCGGRGRLGMKGGVVMEGGFDGGKLIGRGGGEEG